MNRLLFATAALCGTAGVLLLLPSPPQRRSLTQRLVPHAPSSERAPDGRVAGARSLLTALARGLAGQLGRSMPHGDPLAVRLERMHSADDVDAFRLRQGMWALVSLGASTLMALILRPPLALATALVTLGPVVGFAVPEVVLHDRIAARRRRTALEAPLVAEQLAMLLGAGLSLGAALSRIGERSGGPIGEDLRRVMRRLRQGIGEREALDEWAATADVPAISRLVAVLRLHGEAADLGRLVSEEARAARDDAHRSLLALVERKDQQVWVPVTVAALLPGCIFLAVPFADALRPFTG